ncbi:uncharacterized protein LOC110107484, partial [Dendrobium catenatum]|uniref:uncharacterized protein LOC110107484 n=1 Tax=Dendrobium catenatum TaxID=906689 RepID=UPI0009F301D1
DTALGKVVSAKYGRNVWGDVTRRSDSTTWKILKAGAVALRPILCWNVGDGRNIDALNDIWIGNCTLARWPSFISIEDVEGCMVGDFLDEELNWRTEMITACFGTVLGCRILEIPTGCNAGVDQPDLIGSVLNKSITAMAFQAGFEQQDYQFLWFRKFKLHPREHLFWWRLLRGAIPTNEWLHRRGLTEDVRCPWGCSGSENIEHITIRCDVLEQTRGALAKWGVSIPQFRNWDELIVELAMTARDNPCMGRIYCYVVYQIWRARNDKCHGRSFGTPTVIAANVLARLSHSATMPTLGQWRTSQSSGLPINKLWCVPPPGWVKFNVDAAVKANSVAGL